MLKPCNLPALVDDGDDGNEEDVGDDGDDDACSDATAGNASLVVSVGGADDVIWAVDVATVDVDGGVVEANVVSIGTVVPTLPSFDGGNLVVVVVDVGIVVVVVVIRLVVEVEVGVVTPLVTTSSTIVVLVED